MIAGALSNADLTVKAHTDIQTEIHIPNGNINVSDTLVHSDNPASNKSKNLPLIVNSPPAFHLDNDKM